MTPTRSGAHQSPEDIKARLDRLVDELGELPPGDLTRDDLAEVLLALEDGAVVAPPPEQVARTAELVASLPVAGAFRRRMVAAAPARPRAFWSALEVVRSQMPVFGLGFWAASALVTLIAALTTYGLLASSALARAGELAVLALPLAVLSPVAAALGVSYSLRSLGGTGPWEVELSCPITPVGMAVGRLVIVVGYVTGLAFIASVGLWAIVGTGTGLGLLWLTTEAWLFPVLFLAAFSFYLSLRFSPVLGAVAPVALWAVQLVLRQVQVSWSFLVLPGEPANAVAPWIMIALAVLLLAAAAGTARRLAELSEGIKG